MQEHDFGPDYGPGPHGGGADGARRPHGGDASAALGARTRRLEGLQREAAAVAEASAAARDEIARLTALERRLTPEERKTVTRLRLEAEARRLRLQELHAAFERLREGGE